MVTTEPKRPPWQRECVWCVKEIPASEEDQVCPSNSGDKHVLWLFGREEFADEIEEAQK